MSDFNLAADICKVCYLDGDFVLRSGRRATYYFDKYKFEADPELLSCVAKELLPLIPSDIEVLAGLEMGGIPIVTALSYMSGLPAAYIRKAKKGYGTAKLAEGADLSCRRVLIVEDVVTSGGQIILSASDIRQIGGIVNHALCVVDRNDGGSEALSEHDIHLIRLYNSEQLIRSSE